LNQSVKQLRGFCRLLAPVDSGNLEPGLTRLGAEIETAFGITCIVQAPKDPPHLDLNRARLLYSVAQEAVRRAVEKRKAKNVEITLTAELTGLKLVIADDGQITTTEGTPADVELGVRIMRYRAETLGGTVTVSRGAQGGSCVTCEVPIDKDKNLEPFPSLT
jgi:signal transduction histidine kinase